MTDHVNKLTVRIGGISYQLVTRENETYTRQIAAHADELISKAMQENPQISQSMATVLALVNAVDELANQYDQAQNHEQLRVEAERKASEATRQLMQLREEHWDMKKELLRLADLNHHYQALINQLTAPGTDSGKDSHDAIQRDDQDPGRTPGHNTTPDADTAPYPSRRPDQEPAPAMYPDPGPEPDADPEPKPNPEQEPLPDPGSNPEPELEQPLESHPGPDPGRNPEPDIDAGPSGAGAQALPARDIGDLLETKASRPLTSFQQTNLDDYLRSFGLSAPSGDNKQNHA